MRVAATTCFTFVTHRRGRGATQRGRSAWRTGADTAADNSVGAAGQRRPEDGDGKTMGTEVELKLAMGEDEAARLLGHPLIERWGVGKPRVRRLSSVYYDTPERDLSRRGVGLRVRREGRRLVQTIKAEAAGNGSVLARVEDEAEVAGRRPDPSKVKSAAFRRLLRGDGVGERLRPVFCAEISRTTRLLRLDDGTEIELAVDLGEIRNGADFVPVREVELEIKRGAPARLYEVALALADGADGIAIETESKAARGFGLGGAVAPHARKAGAIRLRPEMAATEAFRAIARDCVAQILGSQACALRGEEPEGVHQMRVGARRLRSALSLFRAYIPNDKRRAVNDGLRWLGQQLSPARDWDVFLAGRLRPRLAAAPDDPELRRALADAEAERAEAYDNLRKVLRSRRYTELMLNLLAWIEADAAPAEDDSAAATAAGEAARKILKKRHRRFRKDGNGLVRMNAEELHELRKDAKKLRYAAEFFGSLAADGKAAKAYVKALKRLQDELGAANDDATAHRLEARLAERRGQEGAAAPEVAGEGGEPAAAPDRTKLKKLWARFEEQPALHKGL
jgi:triphosphatase